MRFLADAFSLTVGFRSYPDMILAGLKPVLGFMAKITLLLSVILVFGLLPRLLENASRLAGALQEAIPESEIRAGELLTQAELPVVSSNRFVSVVVTGDETRPVPSGRAGHWLFAFYPRKVMYGIESGGPAAKPIMGELPYSKFPDGDLTVGYFEELFRKTLIQSIPLSIALFFAGSVVSTLGLAGFLTAINTILAMLVGRRDISLGQMFRLALLAQTPALILVTFYAVTGMWSWPLQTLFFIIFTVYLVGGSMALRQRLWTGQPPPRHPGNNPGNGHGSPPPEV